MLVAEGKNVMVAYLAFVYSKGIFGPDLVMQGLLVILILKQLEPEVEAIFRLRC